MNAHYLFDPMHDLTPLDGKFILNIWDDEYAVELLAKYFGVESGYGELA